jgi:hypothetical protein
MKKHSLWIVTLAAVVCSVGLAKSQSPNQEAVNLPEGDGKVLVEAWSPRPGTRETAG